MVENNRDREQEDKGKGGRAWRRVGVDGFITVETKSPATLPRCNL